MALTAFPDIRFNSSTGSDTAASGAGPGDGITGGSAISGITATATASTTVSLSGSPDLSGVATDGSHVLWISGVGFLRIDAVNNTTKTVTVEQTVTAAALSCAIGGKRATLDAATSRILFRESSGVTQRGGSGRWIATLEDNQTLSGSALTVDFTLGTGNFTLRSNSSTKRTITQGAASAALFSLATNAVRLNFENLIFAHSNATKGAVITSGIGATVTMIGCATTNTNPVLSVFVRTGGTNVLTAFDCAFNFCTSTVFNGTGITLELTACEISRNAALVTSSFTSASVRMSDCIVSHNGSTTSHDGLAISTSVNDVRLVNCTFHANAGSGVSFAVAHTDRRGLQIVNCAFTSNGVRGITLTGSTTPHQPLVKNCLFSDNVTAAVSGFTLDASNLTTTPGYTDPSSGTRNFTPGANLIAAGIPVTTSTLGAGQSGSTSYKPIGAVSPQGSGGGTRAYAGCG